MLWLTSEIWVRCSPWKPINSKPRGAGPCPYAILLIAVISVGLWSLIIGVASWLTG